MLQNEIFRVLLDYVKKHGDPYEHDQASSLSARLLSGEPLQGEPEVVEPSAPEGVGVDPSQGLLDPTSGTQGTTDVVPSPKQDTTA